MMFSNRGALLDPPAQNLWVVVPAYNEARLIEGCLDSLAAQSDLTFRIVVVDNASSDDTGDIAHAWIKEHPHLDGCVIQESRKGTGASADTGFRFAIDQGADWIARTDADCLAAHDWISAVKRNSRRAEMVGGKIRTRPGEELSLLQQIYLPSTVAAARLFGKVRPSNSGSRFQCPYVMCVGNNLAVEAHTYEKSGGFPRLAIEELPIPNDRALVNRVRQVSTSIRYAPDMVVYNSARRLKAYGLVRTLGWYANHDLDHQQFEVDVR
jgi:glycosyltransferase involved in cell wall biosynthesis